ncbi:hypothetical protein N0V95_000599 [Ascochyta clinopodiicola]|nr:hypothetical protein N0V95_000599 [Ascochyta clinopodiicola]
MTMNDRTTPNAAGSGITAIWGMTNRGKAGKRPLSQSTAETSTDEALHSTPEATANYPKRRRGDLSGANGQPDDQANHGITLQSLQAQIQDLKQQLVRQQERGSNYKCAQDGPSATKDAHTDGHLYMSSEQNQILNLCARLESVEDGNAVLSAQIQSLVDTNAAILRRLERCEPPMAAAQAHSPHANDQTPLDDHPYFDDPAPNPSSSESSDDNDIDVLVRQYTSDAPGRPRDSCDTPPPSFFYKDASSTVSDSTIEEITQLPRPHMPDDMISDGDSQSAASEEPTASLTPALTDAETVNTIADAESLAGSEDVPGSGDTLLNDNLEHVTPAASGVGTGHFFDPGLSPPPSPSDLEMQVDGFLASTRVSDEDAEEDISSPAWQNILNSLSFPSLTRIAANPTMAMEADSTVSADDATIEDAATEAETITPAPSPTNTATRNTAANTSVHWGVYASANRSTMQEAVWQGARSSSATSAPSSGWVGVELLHTPARQHQHRIHAVENAPSRRSLARGMVEEDAVKLSAAGVRQDGSIDSVDSINATADDITYVTTNDDDNDDTTRRALGRNNLLQGHRGHA